MATGCGGWYVYNLGICFWLKIQNKHKTRIYLQQGQAQDTHYWGLKYTQIVCI